MSLTGAALLSGLSGFIGDDFTGTTTSTGSTAGDVLVDTALSAHGEDSIRDYYIRITAAGTNQYIVRRISQLTSSTGTVTVVPPFPAQVASGVAYEMHRYDPREKFACLDEGRLRAYPHIAQIVFDESLTGDSYSREFDIPASVRKGPVYAFIERAMGSYSQWNFITNPEFDTLTGWTAATVTASLYSQQSADLIVPKYGNTCTRILVNGSTTGIYSQPVASMANGITAALSAGRKMTLGMWVYNATATTTTRIFIQDDGTTHYSATHGGAGWELLTVSAVIDGDNATLLTAGINATTTTSDKGIVFAERSWLYYGDSGRVTSIYPTRATARIRRDDTTQKIMFDDIPPRGRQIRLIGRSPLSALGSTASTQVTNTMEVDEAAAQILYAYSAQTMFERDGIYADMPEEVQARLSIVQQKASEFETKWPFTMLPGAVIQGPFKK